MDQNTIENLKLFFQSNNFEFFNLDEQRSVILLDEGSINNRGSHSKLYSELKTITSELDRIKWDYLVKDEGSIIL